MQTRSILQYQNIRFLFDTGATHQPSQGLPDLLSPTHLQMRTVLVNMTRRSLLSSSVSKSSSATFNFPKIKETGFESQWRKLSEAERDDVEKDYIELGKKDWRQLTFDQMRARKKICLLFINAGFSVHNCLWLARSKRS